MAARIRNAEKQRMKEEQKKKEEEKLKEKARNNYQLKERRKSQRNFNRE